MVAVKLTYPRCACLSPLVLMSYAPLPLKLPSHVRLFQDSFAVLAYSLVLIMVLVYERTICGRDYSPLFYAPTSSPTIRRCIWISINIM